MRTTKIAATADALLDKNQVRPAGSHIRGATLLTGAVIGNDAASVRSSAKAAKQTTSSGDRKNHKRANRIVKQAADAMDSRRYQVAEDLYEEVIALLDAPPPGLWIRRLTAASKASNHNYVVDNYERIRAMASSDDERAIVDQSYIDCLIAAEFFQEALRVADAWSVRKTSSWATIKSIAGVIHARLGNLDGAAAIQRAILDQEPGHVIARWHLALNQLQLGDLPAAFDTYEVR